MKPISLPTTLSLASLAAILLILLGCGKNVEKEVLATDANGFLCADCQLKFYTASDTFPGHCPKCKQGNLQQVLGFVCPDDQYVTVAPRGRSSVPCAKCGKNVQALSIPREKDLVAWGAVKKTKAEVGGY